MLSLQLGISALKLSNLTLFGAVIWARIVALKAFKAVFNTGGLITVKLALELITLEVRWCFTLACGVTVFGLGSLVLACLNKLSLKLVDLVIFFGDYLLGISGSLISCIFIGSIHLVKIYVFGIDLVLTCSFFIIVELTDISGWMPLEPAAFLISQALLVTGLL